MKHRWSGWPGAWCLDCGIEDPMEVTMSNSTDEEEILSTEVPECLTPNSNKFNPYVKEKLKNGTE